MVRAEAIGVSFGGVRALDDVSIEVAEGEILCLVGPSGSGKSTLLRVIAGIERGATGRVVIDGDAMSGGGRFVEPERRRVGMVFQDYALFPHLTVAENVAFGCDTQACAMQMWAKSGGHRRNMLMKGISHYGIASATADNGRKYWVLVLGN